RETQGCARCGAAPRIHRSRRAQPALETRASKSWEDRAFWGRMAPHSYHPRVKDVTMKLKVQLVICTDDGREEQRQEVAILEKDCQRIEHLGLRLAEAKQILQTLQQHLVAQQAATFVATHTQCHDCGATLQTKGQHTRTFRTLFGTVTLHSPRL